ncbi:MAG: hypothetical protein A2W93_14840 [Bacteroidetes bacterium GWF2_43_63]|nr:MAG: hypothetical protein A2W94_01410 [Bacteroidetes bacterium GWE2_42_42]OFY52614.1 MAG: hypothetical protein A2W93_14840 [Bacteroidetes bacterium GWF2_43_63]HBG69887.1 hypothetical protein [Bacteroidales bacterium]HCB62686.1 hypothetical protein [Bacteroidales bacterium]HCY23552.1 hypothetical protein [Bacteroidales bacterium]
MKIRGQYLLFTFLLAFSAMLISCVSYIKMSSENIAPSYQDDFEPLCKSAYIIHLNDSTSKLKINLDPNGFLYVREKAMDPFIANATIRVVLFDSYNDVRWTDSTGTNISFEKDSTVAKSISSEISLNVKTGRNCIAYISVRDNNKDTRQTIMLPVDKSGKLSSQWFEPSEDILSIPSAFTSTNGTTVSLSYHGASPEKLKCYFFEDSFPIPSPPYAFENIIPQQFESDSLVEIEFLGGSNEFRINTFSRGIYFITADPAMNKGFTLLCTESGFPDVNSHEAMMNPIRYISTQKEFKKIAESDNKVAGIEAFWLKIGGHEERTRNLIRKYYSRVMNSNRLFTSHTEGWQTDRGMIYIVFGAPNIVYRTDDSESWIYGEENNFFSITFTFEKLKNKFSDNDYSLQRAPVYKDNWFRAVDIWRQ